MNEQLFFYKSNLIPVGKSFLHVYFLGNARGRKISTSDYEAFLNSFLGARISDISYENFGIFFQVLLICSALYFVRILKSL